MSSSDSEPGLPGQYAPPTPKPAKSPKSPKQRPSRASVRRKGSEWELLGSFQTPSFGAGANCSQEVALRPIKWEGQLSKRRKWPLKGWHKRYFLLEAGVLAYGKTSPDIKRGR